MKLSEIRTHLSKFRVGIAGAGGLGSNSAIALARSGVGTLVICDFDSVEDENLTRQYFFTSQIGMKKTAALSENIQRVNPETVVLVHEKQITYSDVAEIFKGCDVIVEAFDRADMKEMFITSVLNTLPGVPVIAASGLAGWGKSNEIKCRKIDDSLYVCGDESTSACDDLPPLAPRVAMVANMQANVVIDILMSTD